MSNRAAAIIELRKANPCLTLDKVGRLTGVTRERVRQILRGVGMETKAPRPKQQRYTCMMCGAVTINRRFCSRECLSKDAWVEVACDECGRLKRIGKSALIARTKWNKHFYCSRVCAGKVIGRTFGFAAHPENAALARYKRKYDYEMVWREHLETGFGSPRLSKRLGIPVSTINGILHKMRRRVR